MRRRRILDVVRLGRPYTMGVLVAAVVLLLAACGAQEGVGTTEAAEDEATTTVADAPEEETTAPEEEETTTTEGVDAEPIALRFSVESSGDVLANIMNYFADGIEERLGERVSIERFEGGTLGDEIAHMEMVRAGEVDVVPIGSDIVQLDSKFGVFDMPFLFSDRDAAFSFLDGEPGELLAESLLENVGVRILGYGETGFRHVTNNVRPVNTPSDLEGLTLRTPGSPTRILAFEMLGASPTEMDINELYLALDQGVIDGQENPLSVIDAFSLFEVQQYLSLTSHVYSPNFLSINEDTWQTLPSDVQEAFVDAAAEAVEQSRADGIEADQTLLSKFEDAGMEINEVDIASFQEAAGPIWDAIEPEVGEDFFGMVMDWLDSQS